MHVGSDAADGHDDKNSTEDDDCAEVVLGHLQW